MQIFKLGELTANRRRPKLYLVDATDGITPETGEAAGQPQISKNGGAWANTAATLVAIGNGGYYVELTAAELDTLGDISVRYKSANTAEFQMTFPVVAYDPFVVLATSQEMTSVMAGLNDVGDVAARVAGLLHENALLDNEVYDGNGIMTAARLRVFPNATALAAATPAAANDADHELQRYQINASLVGSQMSTYKISRQIGWYIDPLGLKALPRSAAESAALFAAAGAAGQVTNLYQFGLPTTGSVPDLVGSKHLAPLGTVLYQQSIAGLLSKTAKLTSGIAGQFTNATFANVNAASYTIYLVALIDAAGLSGDRSVMRIGSLFDDDACIEITNTPRLKVGEGDATRTVGVSNPTASLRVMVLRVDDAGNTVDAFTDQEKIIGGVQACNGTELRFGGDNTLSWFPPTMDLVHAMVVGSAQSDAHIKAVLQKSGWTPPW